jgi:ATP-dependent Clp protease ATP-binding subunit ClpX
VDTDDLLKFGMIPELIGRFPIISFLEQLDEAAYISILTEPRNSIVKQYRRLMELEGFKLAFDLEALKAIAKKAIAKGTGARGLRSVVEEVMLDVMYEAPSRRDIREITITAEMIEKGGRLPAPEPIAAPEPLPPRSEEEPRRESA